QPVSLQSQKDFGTSSEPANLGAKGGSLAPVQWRRQRCANAVGARVAAIHRAHVQTVRTVVEPDTRAGLQARILVIALRKPAIHAGLEVGIGNPIRPATGEHLDVVHETFSGSKQNDLERIGGTAPIVEHTGEFDVGPAALARLVAV